MGTTLNSVDRLGFPFEMVDEQVFVIPRGGCNEIANESFKFVILIEGCCLHSVDEQPSVLLEAGDVLVLPRICRQRYWPLSADGTYRVHALRLVFDACCLSDSHPGRRGTARAEYQNEFQSLIRQHLRDVSRLALGADPDFRALLATLRDEAEQRDLGDRQRVTALCTELVVRVVRELALASAPAEVGRQTGRVRLVNQAQEYLLKHLSHTIRLSEVAQHLGISPEHLSRVFKQGTGETVFQYLDRLRLETAKTRLLSSDQSVTEIAQATGFSSVSLFSRNFKRYAGISPLRYRQRRWNESQSNDAFPDELR